MLDVMLSLSRIDKEPMRQALHDYLIAGVPLSTAAERHGHKKQQVHVAAKTMREKYKPAFDAYTALVLDSLKDANS
jgi:hypothetical protein